MKHIIMLQIISNLTLNCFNKRNPSHIVNGIIMNNMSMKLSLYLSTQWNNFYLRQSSKSSKEGKRFMNKQKRNINNITGKLQNNRSIKIKIPFFSTYKILKKEKSLSKLRQMKFQILKNSTGNSRNSFREEGINLSQQRLKNLSLLLQNLQKYMKMKNNFIVHLSR